MFGITKETKANNRIQWMPNPDSPIQLGYLKKVSIDEIEVDSEKKKVLNFTFEDKAGEREHVHTEWVIDYDDQKLEKKLKACQQRIKHMYVCYTGDVNAALATKIKYAEIDDSASKEIIDKTHTTNFVKFFEGIVKHFNEDGDKKDAIFTADSKSIPVWVLLTINTYNDKPGLPYSPNFLEVYRANKPPVMQVDKRYHTLVQEGKSSKSGGGNVATDNNIGSGGAPMIPDLPM